MNIQSILDTTEAEFYKRFPTEGKPVSYPHFRGTALEREIKAFIRESQLSLIEAVKGEIEGMKKTWRHPLDKSIEQKSAYNQALSDLLAKLNSTGV